MTDWLQSLLIVPRFQLLDFVGIGLIWIAAVGGHLWRLWRVTSLLRPMAWAYALGKGTEMTAYWTVVFHLSGALERVGPWSWGHTLWCAGCLIAIPLTAWLLPKAIPGLAAAFADLDGRIADLPDNFGKGLKYPDRPLDFSSAEPPARI